ncbi:MAG: hypothetical protein L6Q76_08815 [Polyangiaceae bacterium]|nr:hypothetical protein [Polyangiaceae bacterium]
MAPGFVALNLPSCATPGGTGPTSLSTPVIAFVATDTPAESVLNSCRVNVRTFIISALP